MQTNEAGEWAEERILALVTLILFTVMASYDLLVPILPHYARSWNADETQLGFLFASYAVALLLAVPVSAWVCGRFRALRGLQFGAAGLFLGQVLYASATGRTMLFAARILQGASAGITETAGLALLASAYPARRRGQAMGTAMAGMSLGTLIGPPLGGFLFTWGGPRCPFLVLAAWTLALALGLAFVPRNWASRPAQRRAAPLSGWRDYLGTIGVVMLGAAFLSALEPTLPLHLEERLAATPKECGLLFGLAALLYGMASPLAGWAADRWGGRRVMIAGLIACLLTLPLIALPHSWVGEIAAVAAVGLSCAFLLSPTLPEIAAVCEKHKSHSFGAAYASFNLAYAAGMVVGPVAGGILKGSAGFAPMLLLFSAAAACILPFLIVNAYRCSGEQENPYPQKEPEPAGCSPRAGMP